MAFMCSSYLVKFCIKFAADGIAVVLAGSFRLLESRDLLYTIGSNILMFVFSFCSCVLLYLFICHSFINTPRRRSEAACSLYVPVEAAVEIQVTVPAAQCVFSVLGGGEEPSPRAWFLLLTARSNICIRPEAPR